MAHGRAAIDRVPPTPLFSNHGPVRSGPGALNPTPVLRFAGSQWPPSFGTPGPRWTGPGALNPTTRAATGPDPVLASHPSPRARALPGALNPTPALSLRFNAKPGTNERFAPSGRSVRAIPVAFVLWPNCQSHNVSEKFLAWPEAGPKR